jgi:hypothetical protein
MNTSSTDGKEEKKHAPAQSEAPAADEKVAGCFFCLVKGPLLFLT